MPRCIPSRDEITDDTPLRLEVAAELGWLVLTPNHQRNTGSGQIHALAVSDGRW